MYYSTDSGKRAEFITALRSLADFLDGNPAVPVPVHGDQITLCADSYEDGGKAQVDHIASVLGGTITDDTSNGGHYQAIRDFGPLVYTAIAIPEACIARFDAEKTYRGCVTPDAPPAIAADEFTELWNASHPGCPESGCDRTQPCQGCIDTEELDERTASIRRTQEAWWL